MAISDSKRLLTSEQLQQFIREGYLVLRAQLPDQAQKHLHQRIVETLSQANTGNNVLPQVPEFEDVFNHPVLTGALSSVLGDGYVMHPHRFIHCNGAGRPDGHWHQDSTWGYHRKRRNHRLWWAMVMYYPHDVGLENGPTAVLPGRQYHWFRRDDDQRGEFRCTGAAGSFVLIHYDTWHRSTANTSQSLRYMCKFQFARMDPPTSAQRQQPTAWQDAEDDPIGAPHRTICRHVWNWRSGGSGFGAARETQDAPEANRVGRWMDQLTHDDPDLRAQAADRLGLAGPATASVQTALKQALLDPDPLVSLNASYALAAVAPDAAAVLTDTLMQMESGPRRAASYGLSCLGADALALLRRALADESEKARVAAAQALAELTPCPAEAIDALAGACRDASPEVRLNACDGLGMQGAAARVAIPALIDSLNDAEPEVRFTAARAIARISPAAGDEPLPAIRKALRDENRYVRAYAIEALHRMGSPAALDVLLRHLKMTRWCPITTPAAPFFP